MRKAHGQNRTDRGYPLDVAVNDALAVCRFERRRNLRGEVEQSVDW